MGWDQPAQGRSRPPARDDRPPPGLWSPHRTPPLKDRAMNADGFASLHGGMLVRKGAAAPSAPSSLSMPEKNDTPTSGQTGYAGCAAPHPAASGLLHRNGPCLVGGQFLRPADSRGHARPALCCRHAGPLRGQFDQRSRTVLSRKPGVGSASPLPLLQVTPVAKAIPYVLNCNAAPAFPCRVRLAMLECETPRHGGWLVGDKI